MIEASERVGHSYLLSTGRCVNCGLELGCAEPPPCDVVQAVRWGKDPEERVAALVRCTNMIANRFDACLDALKDASRDGPIGRVSPGTVRRGVEEFCRFDLAVDSLDDALSAAYLAMRDADITSDTP